MIDTGSPAFPTANDDDDDDVAWALSTAHVQWKRGSRADAVVWLRRAIDSAVSIGATWRAAELTRQTDAVETYLLTAAPVPFGPAGGEPSVEDFDGTEMIAGEAVSLHPDDDMLEVDGLLSGDSTDERTDITPEDEQPPARTSVEDATEIEPEADEDDAEVEIEEEIEDIAEVEIAEDDILEEDVIEDGAGDDEIGGDEIADDDLDVPASPEQSEAGERFESEAPTGTFVAPDGLAALEARLLQAQAQAARDDAEEPPATLSEPEPATISEPEPAHDTDASHGLPTNELDSAVAAESEPGSGADAPASPPPPESELAEPLVSGVSLADIRGFEDFPPETQLSLARAARVERLGKEEEVSGFGLALVLHGSVSVMPAIADAACGVANERELVYGRGTLAEGVALRLVAVADGTEVAVWDFETIEPPLADCPWVREELQQVADNYQALAGVSMGPMGERLDDMLRGLVLARCKLVRLLPGELLVEKGKPVGGLFIVGAGRIELGSDPAPAAAEAVLGPGEFLFAQQILMGGKAPTSARAGASGALLMAADRHDAHELMVSVPPLLELLAG